MSNHLPPYLTDAEVEELTGLVQPAAQERFLRSLGIKCFRNARNKVRVSRDCLASVKKARERQIECAEPDFSKIRRAS